MPSALLVFTVREQPVPQGSKVAIESRKPGGRPMVIDDNAQILRPWREKVQAAAESAIAYRHTAEPGTFPALGPLLVDLTVTLPKPKAAPKTTRTYPAVRPDADKLLRAVLDSMTAAGVYRDDGQVCRAVVTKTYPGESIRALHEPGVHVIVARHPFPDSVDLDALYPAPRPTGVLL